MTFLHKMLIRFGFLLAPMATNGKIRGSFPVPREFTAALLRRGPG
jgi:hypothetical protein